VINYHSGDERGELLREWLAFQGMLFCISLIVDFMLVSTFLDIRTCGLGDD
jgi:hypothetical protein